MEALYNFWIQLAVSNNSSASLIMLGKVLLVMAVFVWVVPKCCGRASNLIVIVPFGTTLLLGLVGVLTRMQAGPAQDIFRWAGYAAMLTIGMFFYLVAVDVISAITKKKHPTST